MTSDCCLHNFVTSPCTYGSFEATLHWNRGSVCTLGSCQSCGEPCLVEKILNDSCVPLISWWAGISHPGCTKCLVEGHKSRHTVLHGVTSHDTHSDTATSRDTRYDTVLQVATHSVTPRYESRHTQICAASQVATHSVTPLQVATHSDTATSSDTLWHRITSRDTHSDTATSRDTLHDTAS